MAILDEAWATLKTSIVQVVAPGGVGKTQLVKKWRANLLDSEGHGGAVRAFDWSFYSQGTQRQASADEFFDRALRWFGEAEPENVKDPWAKGERLAELVRQQRTLLILDGMEPLQHPPGTMEGELTDPSVQALLEGLQRDNPGLCIVTTRDQVRVLGEMSEPNRLTIDLGNLSADSGGDLLRQYGINGESRELRQASKDVDGHALTLILLGTFLKGRWGGDIACRHKALLFAGAERYVTHAHKVMASYVSWFEQEDDIGRAAVSILRLMGLFNRPADSGCLTALRAEPCIPGLTEPLFVGDRDELWNRAVERLRAARLLADDEPNHSGARGISAHDRQEDKQTLDAHPLVREYFASELAERLPGSAYDAHLRLYEHLIQFAQEPPNNLSDMLPLYHAVAHGCKAGISDRVFDELLTKHFKGDAARRVLWPLLTEYSWHKFGAAGLTLEALGHFFEVQWERTVEELQPAKRAYILQQAGIFLRARPDPTSARRPTELALITHKSIRDFKEAARDAGNVAKVDFVVGEIGRAIRYAEEAIENAERSCDLFQRFKRRATLAYLLHHAGRISAARMAFDDALAVIKGNEHLARNNFTPLYNYCDLLLDLLEQRKHDQSGFDEKILEQLRSYTTGWGNQSAHFDIALHQLMEVRVGLIVRKAPIDQAGRLEEKCQAEQRSHYIDRAIETFRRVGTGDWLPHGLICRVESKLRESGVSLGELSENVTRDLEAVESIASRASMLIWQVEAALERTRLALALCDREEAKKKLDETRELICETEKPYEPRITNWTDWKPPAYVKVFRPGEIVGYHRRNLEIDKLGRLLN